VSKLGPTQLKSASSAKLRGVTGVCLADPSLPNLDRHQLNTDCEFSVWSTENDLLGKQSLPNRPSLT
jgi:hypothetical protein